MIDIAHTKCYNLPSFKNHAAEDISDIESDDDDDDSSADEDGHASLAGSLDDEEEIAKYAAGKAAKTEKMTLERAE